MIIKFKKSQLDAVMNIWLEANIAAHDFIPASYWHEKYEMVRELIPQSDIFVFEQNGLVKGFIGISEELYIAGLFVSQEFQGQGIGKDLLNNAKRKYSRLILNVYPKNEKAFHFYEKSGFSITEEGMDKDTGEVEFTMEWQEEKS